MRWLLSIAVALSTIGAPGFVGAELLTTGVTGGSDGNGSGLPSTPSNAYVAEDGATFYVAEDGATYYVQEI
jgi:hypothetical protein